MKIQTYMISHILVVEQKKKKKKVASVNYARQYHKLKIIILRYKEKYIKLLYYLNNNDCKSFRYFNSVGIRNAVTSLIFITIINNKGYPLIVSRQKECGVNKL